MAFDIEGARKAGYSDAEIASALASKHRFDIDAAKKAGYADSEIIAKLASRDVLSHPGVPAPAAAPQEDQGGPGVLDRAAGIPEALATVVTGATTGTIAGALGGLNQMGKDIVGLARDGRAYQPEQSVGDAASNAARALTYEPRSQTGRDILQNVVAPVAENLIPIAPIAAAGPAGAIRSAAEPIKDAAMSGAVGAAKAADRVLARAAETAREYTQGGKPTAGTMGSVGAAGTEKAAERIATAQALPEPISLTKGQADRSFEQQRFEAETAKDPRLGAPLRERSMQQNRQLAANFEAMIDGSGAQATNLIETGRTVDKALVQAAAKRKSEYRAKYKEAEKAGQMEDPVSTAPVVQFLEENASSNAPELAGGTLGIAQRELLRLGGAEMVDGKLVPREMPLRNVELLRRQIGNAMDAAPDNATNTRMGAKLKELIDTNTEGLGGDLYKEARSARRRYAQLFEDNAIVSNLLKTRRGTADRQVALEDVFRKTILNGDRESIGKLRRTLQVAGGEQGAQAWKELQGATLRHLLDEATKGVGSDAAGNPMFSAAKLNNAVRALDADGRLDFVLSKKGAQTVRDINEIAKVVLTTPPGTINHSNTASVILAALTEAGVSGSLVGLPVPVLTGMKILSQQVKDAKVRKRVTEALREAEQK